MYLETRRLRGDLMEDDSIVFLNLVVDKIDTDHIKEFMLAWMKQSCKDFRIVFIDKDLSEKQKTVLDYARGFAKAIGLQDQICIVKSLDEIPSAKQTKHLKDTSILPADKMEVLKMRTEASKQKIEDQKIEKLEEKAEQNIETKNAIENRQKLVETNDATKMMLQQKPMKDEVDEKKEVEKAKAVIKDRCNPRIVCYTCITSGYDTLKPLSYQQQSIDLICFTDNKNIKSNGWILKDIPSDLKHLSKVKQQRILKIHPQKYLSEYDISLWIDGNFVINCDIEKDFLPKYDLNRFSLYTNKHPLRDCIYDEEIECIKRKKDISQNTHPQIERYKQEKMPRHVGLAETNLMLRDHRDPKCEEVMKLWELEVLKGSHRDQLSFNYACWKLGFKYGYLYLNAEYRKFKSTNQFNLLKHNEIIKQPLTNKNKVGIVIINYNTNALVNALIKSIKKTVKSIDYDIVVFDNSTNEKFICPNDVKLIDNSKNSFINFMKIIKETSCVPSSNNYASYKHAMTVQFLLNILQYNDLIFLDSDILLKRDIDFIDQRFAVIADYPDKKFKPRFIPFIMYFNQSKIKSKNIKYLDIYRMHGGANASNSCIYDTGCSFYEDVTKAKLPVKKINYEEYIVHFGGGSWRRSKQDQNRFLTTHAKLWR